MRISALITFVLAGSVTVGPQPLSSQSRAQEIAAAFTKHKHAAKERHGARREKYKDVQSEPTIRQDVTDYAGVYEVEELGYLLHVRIIDDGAVRVFGSDGGGERRSFDLENATIQGALLTGTRVYHDGATEEFAAAFLTRTDRDSPTDPGTTLYGLGVLLPTPIERNGITYDKLFYRLKH